MTVDTTDVITLIRDGDKVGLLVYLRNRGDPNARNPLGWTLLHIACLEGQAEITGILLDAGATINSCTTDMCTPLHRACSGGNEGSVKVLLEKGAYINAQDKYGNTPLHEAAKGLHTSVVKLLIEKKADRSRVNKKNQIFTDMVGQQLMPVVESGDIDTLIAWLDWGLSANTFGNLNWSLLHHASAMGQINIASVLLERGANVNAIDSNRSSPLHGSCFHGHKRIVELLIGRKADVDIQDQRGNTPLHSAITGSHPDIINLLLDSGSDTTIPNKEGQIFTHLVNEFLQDAIDKNKVAYVISLLKGRANPNTTDAAGTPVLCSAAFKGEILLVDALLEANADPNLCSKDSRKSPLHYAASAGHLFVLKSLLDKNASVHLIDRNGSTALHEACREGAEDVITVLCGRGASLNAQDIDGNTPLHIAARWGQTAAVELLIEKGASDDIKNKSGLLSSDLALMRAVRTENASHVLSGLAWGGNPDVQDEKGWTLLHHAAYKGALEVCEVLIESGANVDIMDKHGRTPLLLAAYRGNQEIMERLLNNSANMNAQDNKGQTPLHWAADEGSIGAVELLLQRGADRSLRNKKDCLYSDLLLKHLYFAVRHNDAQKVECLLKAGADQTAVLRGTGTTPRDEAKRRKLYPILKKMVAMAPKKKILPPSKDASYAIEDVSRLFENHDDQGQSSSDESSHEEEWDPDEDAYWKMHNASIVLKAKDIFQEEEQSFWENWEEKPKIISAKEFFKDELPWWVTKESSSGSESSSDESESAKNPTYEELKQDWGHVIPAKEFFRDDECWWRDAVEEIENIDKQKVIPAKEFFKDDTPWWETNSEDDEKQEEWVPAKEYFKDDKPWWETDETTSIEDISISDMEIKKTEETFVDEDFDESLTDDWDTANESMISDTSTMFSASEGEKVTASEMFAEQPWWDIDNEDVTEDIDIFNSNSLGKESLENISDNIELTKVNEISSNIDKLPVIRQLRKMSLTESESSATLLDSYGSNEALNDVNYINDDIFDNGDLKLNENEFSRGDLMKRNSIEVQNTFDVNLIQEETITNKSDNKLPEEEITDMNLEGDKNILLNSLENPNIISHKIFEFGNNEIQPITGIILNLEAEDISNFATPNVEHNSSFDEVEATSINSESRNTTFLTESESDCKLLKQEEKNPLFLMLQEIDGLIEDKNVELNNQLEAHCDLQIDVDEDPNKNLTMATSNLHFPLSENDYSSENKNANLPFLNKIDNLISGEDVVNKIADSKQQKYLKYRDEKQVNVSKPVINKMDACLAKVDATLAWLDARMANDNPSDSNNFCRSLHTSDSGNQNTNLKISTQYSKKDEGSENASELPQEGYINIFKINVRVPDEIYSKCENTISIDNKNGLEHTITHHSLHKISQSKLEDIIGNADPLTICNKLLSNEISNKVLDPNSNITNCSKQKGCETFLNDTTMISKNISKENLALNINKICGDKNLIKENFVTENKTMEVYKDLPLQELQDRISSKRNESQQDDNEDRYNIRTLNFEEADNKEKINTLCDINLSMKQYVASNNVNLNPSEKKHAETLDSKETNSELPNKLGGQIQLKDEKSDFNELTFFDECNMDAKFKVIEEEINSDSTTPISAKLQVVLKSGAQIISTTPDSNNFQIAGHKMRPPRRKSKKLDSQNSSIEDCEEDENTAKVETESDTTITTKHYLGCDLSTNTDTNSFDMPPTAPRRKRDLQRSPIVLPSRSSDIHFIDSIKPKNYQINLLSDSDPAETSEIDGIFQHPQEQLTEVRECSVSLISTTAAEASK